MLMANGDKKLQSGDLCPQCGKGRLYVRTSKRVSQSQVQRLECGACYFAEVTAIPANQVRRRRFDD